MDYVLFIFTSVECHMYFLRFDIAQAQYSMFMYSICYNWTKIVLLKYHSYNSFADTTFHLEKDQITISFVPCHEY